MKASSANSQLKQQQQQSGERVLRLGARDRHLGEVRFLKKESRKVNREFVDSDAATSTTRASRKVRATSSRRRLSTKGRNNFLLSGLPPKPTTDSNRNRKPE